MNQNLWWPWIKRGATLVFFGLVLWLLATQARNMDWAAVRASLENYPLSAVWGAVALAVASFGLYSCFDLMGRHYTGHRLSAATVMVITFVSYAFNLNLGSVVGGIALRYRLYSRFGLRNGVITRVMSISMLSNWMGYVLLAGLVFSFKPPAIPINWATAVVLTSQHARWAGFALVVAALAYLAACAFSPRRMLSLRGHSINLPSLKLAALQLGMGATNWLLMSGVIFVLLQQQIDYFTVVSVLLLAAVAGVITHVPGNLGVLEAVFLALLSDRLPAAQILAALVAYRVIYYFIPLALGSSVYLLLEAKAKKLATAHLS